ncbi:MAG: SMP-30/gluconolactonase/LRE family protein [Nocardiopsaceae bacterium]|nr:SMP-30/gluconolactonase/LRE family protein [Nocardiopsaceae bacterium]
MTVLMEGIVFGESPRWHDGRVWFSDWGVHQVIALDPGGRYEVIASVPSFPMCIDFLPDGRLLVVDSARRRLLRREPSGSMACHADLGPISGKPWNDLVVDARGNAYVNNIGFDFPGGKPAPGIVALVTPEGSARPVAGNLAFPNGMAITADGGTLIVAESHASRLTAYDIGPGGGLDRRRVWAATPGDHPDGICVDSEGAVWYADVAGRRCVRIREGGEILASVELDRGAFSCTLSRGDQPPQLYVVGQQWNGAQAQAPTGQVLVFPAPASGAGKP